MHLRVYCGVSGDQGRVLGGQYWFAAVTSVSQVHCRNFPTLVVLPSHFFVDWSLYLVRKPSKTRVEKDSPPPLPKILYEYRYSFIAYSVGQTTFKPHVEIPHEFKDLVFVEAVKGCPQQPQSIQRILELDELAHGSVVGVFPCHRSNQLLALRFA